MNICPQCGKRYPVEVTTCQEDGSRLSALADDPYLGYQLANFQLLKRIGRGGFGVVYLAQHVALGNQVAVKILKKQYTSDQQLVERFRREARVSSQINHENVVHIVDFGYDNELGFYYIMEYLDGKSLTDVMKEHPRGMPIERLQPIMRQICSALEQAHANSVVHRDLKPSNIFLVKRFNQDDVVKILDFGIAKVLQGEEGSNMTVTGQIVGSPRFMSPEQARGRHSEVDPRSDIYSLGVILFWTLTGRLPFESKQLARLLYMHVKMPPPDLAKVAPHLTFTPQLEALVQSALAKRKDDRPSSAGELYQRFEQACSGVPAAAPAYPAEDRGPSMTVQMRPPSSASSVDIHHDSLSTSPSPIPPAALPPAGVVEDPLDSTQIDGGQALGADLNALLANDSPLEETVNLPSNNSGSMPRHSGLTSGVMSPPSAILSSPHGSTTPSVPGVPPPPPAHHSGAHHSGAHHSGAHHSGAHPMSHSGGHVLEDSTSLSLPRVPSPVHDARDTSPSQKHPVTSQEQPTPSSGGGISWKFILLGLLILILIFQLAFIGWKLWQKRSGAKTAAPARYAMSHIPPSQQVRADSRAALSDALHSSTSNDDPVAASRQPHASFTSPLSHPVAAPTTTPGVL